MSHGPLRGHLSSRRQIAIEHEKCIGCRLCMRNCPALKALAYDEETRKVYLKDPLACGGCGACLRGCPVNAIHMQEQRRQEGIVILAKTVKAPGQNK